MLKLIQKIVMLGPFLFLVTGGCKIRNQEFILKDSSILTTPVEDQRGSTLCWSYTWLAHLEQRYLRRINITEAKQIPKVNFSEEYLGLVLMGQQLMNGEWPNESLLLSLGVELIDRFGLVPEWSNGQEYFRVKIDESYQKRIFAAAEKYWDQHEIASNTKLSVSAVGEIFSLAFKENELNKAELEIILRALSLDFSKTTFEIENKKFTPKSLLAWIVGGSMSDSYYSVRMNFDDPLKNFELTKAMKKSLLYGYSIPLSFNFINGAKQLDGKIYCEDPTCADATLSHPDGEMTVHANHAVLAIDYSVTENSPFVPVDASSLRKNYDAGVFSWLVKNSWGFNHNLTFDHAVLLRQGLPTYTIIQNPIFEASYRLNPGRYEVILPKKICFHGDKDCSDLVVSDGNANDLALTNFSLDLNTESILKDAASVRFNANPIAYQPGIKDLGEYSRELFSFQRELVGSKSYIAKAEKVSWQNEDKKNFCFKINPETSELANLAVFVFRRDNVLKLTPQKPFILSENNSWSHCFEAKKSDFFNDDNLSIHETLRFVFQGLDKNNQVLGQRSITLDLTP